MYSFEDIFKLGFGFLLFVCRRGGYGRGSGELGIGVEECLSLCSSVKCARWRVGNLGRRT